MKESNALRAWTRKPLSKRRQLASPLVSSLDGVIVTEFRRGGPADEQELQSRLARHARALSTAADSLGLDLPELLADLRGPDEDSTA